MTIPKRYKMKVPKLSVRSIFYSLLCAFLTSSMALAQVIEKTYLTTDKEIYEPEDTVWFKGYVFDDVNVLSDNSIALHIVISDEDGNKLRDTSWPIYDGVCYGQLIIPNGEGKYYISATSGKMTGVDTDQVFSKEIYVRSGIADEILLTAEFDQENNQVNLHADLSEREVAADERFVFELWSNTERISRGSVRTDTAGNASIRLGELNDGQDIFNVTIRSTDNNLAKEVKVSLPVRPIPKAIDLQFFPEGGQLVAGVSNRVAFKAIDDTGKPFDFSGRLFGPAGEVVDTLTSDYKGMGAFFLTPELGFYTVKIEEPIAFNATFQLPEAQASGISMAFVDSPNEGEKLVRLIPSESNIGDQITLRITQFDETIESFETTVDHRRFFPIPTTEIYPGIAKATLYDQNMNTIAERLFFANEDEKLSINIETDKEFYLPREKVEVTLTVRDIDNEPVRGNFSLAAIDDTRAHGPNDQQPHLLAQVLLNSELKGTIPTPNFYFSGDPRAREYLDLVMMTHGWRKYSPSPLGDPEALIGTLIHRRNKKKVIANTELSLINLTNFFTEDIPVDDEGNFYVGSELFKSRGDSFLLSTQVRKKDEKPNMLINDTTRLSLINHKKNIITTLGNRSLVPDFSIYQKVNKIQPDRFQNTLILNSVTVKARRLSNNNCVLNDAFFEYPWTTKTVAELDLSDLDIVTLLKQVSVDVRGYGKVQRTRTQDPAAGGAVTAEPGSRGVRYPMVFSYDALLAHDVRIQEGVRGISPNGTIIPKWTQTVPYFVMINCKPIRPANNTTLPDDTNPTPYDHMHRTELESIDFRNIESISVKTAGISLTPMILINTIDGVVIRKPRLLKFHTFATFYNKPVEFYQPKYETEEARNLQIPDLRTTIHWASNVITDEEGKAKLSFYNADRPNRIRITVEGINGDSQMGFAQKDYRVLTPSNPNQD